MRSFLAALSFLTRVPFAQRWEFGAADVGRATLFFPVVGAGLGACGAVALAALSLGFDFDAGLRRRDLLLPPPVVAALLVALSAWLTGGLHLDGLADMADGFGGGRTREEILRIMRDPLVGSYGVVALVLLLLLKWSALAVLIDRGAAATYLILAPALARWASVPLGMFLPYARREDGGLGAAITDHVGWRELGGATALAAAVALPLAGRRGVLCWVAVVIVTAGSARLCRRRLGGITGDTLGANTEVAEAAVLLVAVGLTS
jgi:cobalamin 5'-phosphate synthase/cobalamin synthase